VWEPLLAIADVAGGHWPATARRCGALCDECGRCRQLDRYATAADVRALFLAAGVARMTTADVLAGLLDADEASWGDLDELELVMVTAELHRVAVLGTAGPRRPRRAARPRTEAQRDVPSCSYPRAGPVCGAPTVAEVESCLPVHGGRGAGWLPEDN
jgi:hypothetical protein